MDELAPLFADIVLDCKVPAVATEQERREWYRQTNAILTREVVLYMRYKDIPINRPIYTGTLSLMQQIHLYNEYMKE